MPKKPASNTPQTNEARSDRTSAQRPAVRPPPSNYKRINLDPQWWAGHDTHCALIDIERTADGKGRAVDAVVFVALEPTLVVNNDGTTEHIAKGKPFRVDDPRLLRVGALAGDEEDVFPGLLIREPNDRIAFYLRADPVKRGELASFDPFAPPKQPETQAQAQTAAPTQ